MQVEAILKPFQRFGVHLGLERIKILLANLGNPHHQVPIIHVAGTNGKGSVCAYLSAVLTAAGYKTGRYISPHLIDWNERICINEEPITQSELSQVILQVQEAISPDFESPTQFEIFTAAAWLYFAQQQVDIAVIEVGLGGRLDATNVIDSPLVSIITSISREHWQQLGPTITDIAGEKAGVIKSRCPVVVGQLPEEANQVIFSKVKELNSPIYYPFPAQFVDTPSNRVQVKSLFHSQFIEYPLVLNGQIQQMNSALAVAALEVLQYQGWDKINAATIGDGMAKAKWPGRMQWINWTCNQNPEITRKILIDGAHNPAAAKALRHYIDSLQVSNITWVMGMLSTKEHEDIFHNLLRSHDQLYLLPVPDHSSANPVDLQKLALKTCPQLADCQIFDDVTAALDRACENHPHSPSSDHLVVFCGSLYLIGHFLKTSRPM